MDIYKAAVQKGLRFPSNRGKLNVEQLFDLRLKESDNFDLDTVARDIYNELKEKSEGSFVNTTDAADPRKVQLELMLEIVKDVIKTKQDEDAAQLARIQRMNKRKRLNDLLEMKENEELAAATKDELRKQLAELDAAG